MWLKKYNPNIDWPTNSLVVKTRKREPDMEGNMLHPDDVHHSSSLPSPSCSSYKCTCPRHVSQLKTMYHPSFILSRSSSKSKTPCSIMLSTHNVIIHQCSTTIQDSTLALEPKTPLFLPWYLRIRLCSFDSYDR